MPLIVHCPNGCVIRVPLARAGMIVRCSQCKSAIQLRPLTPMESAGGQAIEVRASLANIISSEVESVPAPQVQAFDAMAPKSAVDREQERRAENLPTKGASSSVHRDLESEMDSLQAQHAEKTADASQFDQFELPVPQPSRLRFARNKRMPIRSRRSSHPATQPVDAADIDLGLSRPNQAADFESIQIDEDDFEDRSEDECRFLSQFYAACIGVMGMVLIVPSLLAWGGWSALPVEPLGSRWIFIMIFLGALHIVYAVFLFQIQDRSALWPVSIFLLLVGCIHGIFTAGTWLDQGNGPVSRFLQLPPTETAAVTLWCFLHLCFSVLLSYLCGRHALRWKLRLQRMES